MKKILSIVLALAMIFSLSINAFAYIDGNSSYKFTDSKGREITSLKAGQSATIYLRNQEDKQVKMRNLEIYRGEHIIDSLTVKINNTGDIQNFTLKISNKAERYDIVEIEFDYYDYDNHKWIEDNIYEFTIGSYSSGNHGNGSFEDVDYDVDDYGRFAEFDKNSDTVYIGFDSCRVIYKAEVSSSKYKFDLKYDTDDHYKIEDRYPNIYCEFFNVIHKPTFARTGTLYFETDCKYIYSIDDKGRLTRLTSRIEEQNGVEYLAVRTRQLDHYVLSERPLNESSSHGGSDEYADYVDYDVDIDGYNASFDPRYDETVLIGFNDNTITYEAAVSQSRYEFDLHYSTRDRYGIKKNNPSARCEFFSATASPRFSRSGKLSFYTNLKYLYSIDSDGKLTKLNPSIDRSTGSLYINTSRLGNYVLSDKPLSNTSSSSSSKPSKPSKPSTPSKPSSSQTGSVEKLNVSSSAIKSANREGRYAVVNLNGDKIYTSGNDLVAAGKNLAYGEKLIARRVNGKRVDYQWYIDAKNAGKASSKLELGMTINDTAIKSKFEKWFSNKVAAVTFNHKGSMGINTSVAVKADLTGLNKNTLIAYLYNASTNTYKKMTNANLYVDSAGYVHFNINEGGTVIITDRTLR